LDLSEAFGGGLVDRGGKRICAEARRAEKHRFKPRGWSERFDLLLPLDNARMRDGSPEFSRVLPLFFKIPRPLSASGERKGGKSISPSRSV